MFSSILEEGEDEDEAIEESILELCEDRLEKSSTLSWHYRSKHPDLIRFSNEKFYDGLFEKADNGTLFIDEIGAFLNCGGFLK